MIRESKHRDEMKERVKDWMAASGVHSRADSWDMTIMETFFFIYYSLSNGESIHEIGNKLGVLPLP